MWKHKIIEDLIKCKRAYLELPEILLICKKMSINPNDFYNILLNSLIKSTCFHIEKYYYKRDAIIEGPVYFKFINLPFNPILITTLENETKEALLCLNMDGESLFFIPFIYKKAQIWEPTCLSALINNKMYFYNISYPEECFDMNYSVLKQYKEQNLRQGIPNNKVETMRIEDTINNLIYCKLKTLIELLSCKNILTQEILPSEKLNKKRKQKNKTPIYSYKVLTINTNYLRKKHRSDNLNDPKYHVRLHFCRGHIKTYTEQNKLFGKITGSFWWEPCLKGNVENGFIDKDYKIK
jgi:hypothetical protein